MFYPQPSQPPSVQPKIESKSELTEAFKAWQGLQKTFFLIACGCSSLAVTNLIRVAPAYFWLYAILMIVAITSLLFFPDKRPGSLAIGVGIVLASWEFVAVFRFQVQHWLVVVGLVAAIFVVLAAVGGKNE